MRVPALLYTALSSFVIVSTWAAPTPILKDVVTGLGETVGKLIPAPEEPKSDEVSANRAPWGVTWKREAGNNNQPTWKREAGNNNQPTWKRDPRWPAVWKTESEPEEKRDPRWPPGWRTKPEPEEKRDPTWPAVWRTKDEPEAEAA